MEIYWEKTFFQIKSMDSSQFLLYLDSCVEAIANGDVIDVIYFDFAKVFDTVPHRKLLKKIESYKYMETS